MRQLPVLPPERIACLLARKLSESGVRFVQVTMDGWDHHGDIRGNLPREHQPESFCAWMSGGGVKGGLRYGETDEMGYRLIDGKIHIHNLHATMMHLLGIDHTKLTWNHLPV